MSRVRPLPDRWSELLRCSRLNRRADILSPASFHAHAASQLVFDGSFGRRIFRPKCPRPTGFLMTPYLRLTDAQWQASEPHLPRQRSGPGHQNDRETVTAFLFAQAAGVSLDCLPDCGFPNPLSLRTTWQRWRARGEIGAVLQAGRTAQERMRRQYEARIRDLSLRPPRVDRPTTIGHRSKTMPRWTHVRAA